MQDERKTKKQLVRELRTLRAKLKKLEKSDDDTIEGVQIISHDITERLSAEQAGKRAEEALKFTRFSLDNAADTMVCVGHDARFIDVNDAFCRSSGYSREELLSMTVHDIDPDYSAEIWPEFWEKLKRAGSLTFETRHRTKDGKVFPVEITANFFEYNGEEYHCSFARNITERKKVQDELRKSIQLLNDTGKMAKVGAWELDLSTKEVSMTEEVCRIHGVEPGYKLKLEEAMSFYAPESKPALEEVLKKATESGEPYDLESLFIPSGSKEKIWVRSLGKAVYSGGKIVKLAGTFQNIDKYKRTEEALRESEIKYRNIFENVIEGIFQVTPEGRFRIVNPALAHLYRYSSPEEMIETITDIGRQLYVNPEERLEFLRILHEKGSVTGFEVQLKRKDGSTFWASVNVRCVYDENGNILYHEGTSEDITERKLAEQASRRAEEELRKSAINLAESQRIGKLGCWDWDIAGNSLSWSDETYCIWGVGKDFPLTFENIVAMIHPDDREFNSKMIQEFFATRDEGKYEFRIICPDGTAKCIYQSVEVTRAPSGQPIRMFGIMHDITERKRAEESLRKQDERYKRVIENIFKFIPEGVLVFTDKLRLFNRNKTFDDIVRIYSAKLGYTEQELTELIFGEVKNKLAGEAGATIRIPKKTNEERENRTDHSIKDP